MTTDYLMIIVFAFCLFSGAADGAAETLKFHTAIFFKRFEKANKWFWDPSVSWTNKYKDNDPAKGPKFWQSTKALVFSTDGYHLMRMLRNQFIIIAILVKPTLPEWYMWPAAWVLCYLAYTAGFSYVFDHFFSNKK